MTDVARGREAGSGLLATVAICFFATGGAGLIYEIVWSHHLALVMGNTAYALATLLTVFMGGLALGAWLGGWFSPRGAWALRTYGILELVLGLYCLALPSLFEAAEPLFALIYREHYGSLVRFNLLQFGVVAALLLLPTTLMGATLPVLTRFLVHRLGVVARIVSRLYAVNAAGAFAGAMLAGIVLLPAYGARATYLVAVTINLVVGLVAVGISLAGAAATGMAEAETEPEPRGKVRAKRSRIAVEAQPFPSGVLLSGFALSGFAAMVYQVAWTRAITLSFGSSTYAFTLIASAFILGLALGSIALGWLGDRPAGRLAVGVLSLVIAFAAVLTIGGLADLPVRATRLLNSAQSFAELEWAQFSMIAGLFLPATIAMGALFPIVSRLLTRSGEGAARSVGEAYAANALGTIVGSFLAGFVMIPWIGMRGSLLAAAAASAAVGLLFLYHALGHRPQARAFTAIGVVLGTALILAAAPRWDRAVLTSGPFIRAAAYGRGGDDSSDAIRRRMAQDIIYYREGVATVVTVTQEGQDGGRRLELAVGGKPDAFSYASTQNWLGHLPMLLRPDARRVLVIGLGSGHTLASVLRHPSVEHVDVVEISAEVAEAARLFFGEFTGRALEDPRVNLIVGDGRLHLEHTDQTYDAIVSQPSNPWIAGAAALFTREAFASMRARLNEGGLACIWFQGFRMPVQSFRTLTATWDGAWEHPSIWTSRISGEHLFVGAQTPLAIDYTRLAERFRHRAVAEQLDGIRIPTPAHALGYLAVADDGLAAIAGEAPLNTDDHLRIAYEAPRGLSVDHANEILLLLNSRRIDPWSHVVPGAAPPEDFAGQRELGATILANQREIARALALPPEARRPVLEAVVARDPLDATARRELTRTGAGRAEE